MTIHISQAQYNAYNRRYNNLTYRAVMESVRVLAPHLADRAADLLINASFGRLGVAEYADCEVELLTLMRPVDAALVAFVQRHLDNFSEDFQAEFAADLRALNHNAHALAQQANALPGYCGRAAFHFLDAACYLLMMACRVQMQDTTLAQSYLDEKFRRALKTALAGLLEVEKGDG